MRVAHTRYRTQLHFLGIEQDGVFTGCPGMCALRARGSHAVWALDACESPHYGSGPDQTCCHSPVCPSTKPPDCAIPTCIEHKPAEHIQTDTRNGRQLHTQRSLAFTRAQAAVCALCRRDRKDAGATRGLLRSDRIRQVTKYRNDAN